MAVQPVQAPRLLFYVQHLLGIGHMKRAALLAQGLCRAGIDVFMVSGGEPVDGVSFEPAHVVQLPALKAADSDFSGLVTAAGEPVDETFKSLRRDSLLHTFEAVRPDILLIESYPFGRRQLRWELKPLLQAARDRAPRPLVLCSLRDILQARKPERVDETLRLVERYIDGMLVHGDPRFIPLEASFPRARELADKVHYTGYVCQLDSLDLGHPGSATSPATEAGDLAGQCDGAGEVLVSAGGGAVGFAIMDAALKARPQCHLNNVPWRFLIGPNLPAPQLEALRDEARGQTDVIFEGLRPDFRDLLSRCRLSISQAGYNTIMDLLVTGAPSLLIPFEGQGETEQRLRTERLTTLGQSTWVSEAALSPETLASAIDGLSNQPRAAAPQIDLNGARGCAEQVLALWRRFR